MNEENRKDAANGLLNRRDFLKTSAASAATAALLASGNYAHAQGSDTIRIGLIGCGGRGTGAAGNATSLSQGVEVIAMADMFEDHVTRSKRSLKEAIGDKYKVTDDRTFIGFDAHKKLLALPEVNYVILATPPGFRPIHLRAAVEAGKQIFMEKPVAVDGQGIKSVIESGAMAKAKNLSIVAGTQRRHQASYIETIKRIHDGAMGDVVGGQVYWNGDPLWSFPKQPGWTDLEWQLRNWYYFTYVCGDHIVEQHVHNLDVMNWVMGGHPEKAIGLGGRQVRVDPLYGHIYDHFAVEFTYANGVKIQSMCRQQSPTATNVSERFVGTKGVTDPGGWIKGATSYDFPGDRNRPDPYAVEHADNIAAIRAGKPLNEARQVAESTLNAILGREACYTGQELTWNQVLNSTTVLMPDVVRNAHGLPSEVKDSIPTPPVAMPGQTKLERAWNG